jgi:UDP-glucose 4-epimerase
MNILVTGGAGFIGSHIVEHYQGQGKIRVLDNFRSGYKRNLAGFDVELVEGSVLDRKAVAYAVEGIDFLFHLAAMISVPESMDNPIECTDINTNGTLTVLEEAAKAGVKKLVFSSSAAIYGDNPIVPKVETMLPEPKSPYAVSKLDGEYYCKIFHDTGRLNTVCLRYFNVFGPRQDPNSQYAAAVPIFLDKALQNEAITIFGDGLQTRDFIYVKDVVRANAHLATRPEATGVHNVAYGNKITIRDLASKIIDLTGSSSKIEHAAERVGDVKHSLAKIDKLLATGFEPRFDFDRGLAETIEYFKCSVR